jgi:hypothetical protein
VVGQADRHGKQTVVANREGTDIHCDRFDVRDAQKRKRFFRELAKKVPVVEINLPAMDSKLLQLAATVDDTSDHTQPGESASIIDALKPRLPGLDLFLSSDGQSMAQFEVSSIHGQHLETERIRSARFRAWIRLKVRNAQGRSVGNQAIEQLIDEFAAECEFCDRRREVSRRIARSANCIYIDLGNERWNVVRIDATGRKLLSFTNRAVFRRSRTTGSLPSPAKTGDIRLLSQLINLADESDLILLAGTLIGLLQPNVPKPVIAFFGPEGSAKSSACCVVKALIDPETVALPRQPNKEDQVYVAAEHRYLLAYDNLSYLPDWLSDAFCNITTGGGRSARQLYTDSDESFVSVLRPVVINGIPEIGSRPDFLSRLVSFLLAKIESGRITEVEFRQRLDKYTPRILAALYDGVAHALRTTATQAKHDLPRLADFARFAMNAMPAFGWRPEQFLRALERNQRDSKVAALQASPIYHALKRFMKDRLRWSGSATQLLQKLNSYLPDWQQRPDKWPRDAKALSTILRRLEVSLAEMRIRVQFHKSNDERTITLTAILKRTR